MFLQTQSPYILVRTKSRRIYELFDASRYVHKRNTKFKLNSDSFKKIEKLVINVDAYDLSATEIDIKYALILVRIRYRQKSTGCTVKIIIIEYIYYNY